MPYSNSMKISRACYNDLAADLRQLFNSAERTDPMEWAILTRMAGGDMGGAHGVFRRLWLNTDLDDSHPRFNDGESEAPDGTRIVRFAALRHVPFKGRGAWIDRLYKAENLTDDQIATAVGRILDDFEAEAQAAEA
ncbi:MAG: hypothetical protein DI640_13150 [Sphingomonas taxi]|uniref:Uncharacterized protein n=1 Tax=Sphingomonas taxi TaxID=1549858 RepID=A0A2W5AMJ6_9SPHN|nr:MAG: hypothetical protein DI640_13150 [Sphingomonas taxi]